MLHYLFGFSGRINRARMWLFILVVIVWEIVIGAVAVFGFGWSRFAEQFHALQTIRAPDVAFPMPESLAGAGAVAGAVIGVLFLALFLAMLAVTTKRLHDRNKGAIWLIPFVVIPWGVGILRLTVVAGVLALGAPFTPFFVGLGAARLIATVFGIWAILELYFFRGTIGANRFGPDPLER